MSWVGPPGNPLGPLTSSPPPPLPTHIRCTQAELRELRGEQEVMMRVARGIVIGGDAADGGDVYAHGHGHGHGHGQGHGPGQGHGQGHGPPTVGPVGASGVPLTTFQETVTELQVVKVACDARLEVV